MPFTVTYVAFVGCLALAATPSAEPCVAPVRAARFEARRPSAGGHLIVAITRRAMDGVSPGSGACEREVRIEPLSANRLLAAPDDELVVYLSRPNALALELAAKTVVEVAAGDPN